MIHNTFLEAQVEAWNKTHAEVNRIRPLLIEFFRPYVGKKVLITGGFIKKIRETLPKVGEGFRLWPDSSYSLRFEVSHDENYKARDYSEEHKYCHSARANVTFYVGDFNRVNFDSGCDLEKVHDISESKPLRTDYTVEEVRSNRRALADAEDGLSAAQRALHPFEKYDR